MGARTCLATSNVIGRRMALSFNLVCPFQIKKKENKAHGVWTLPSLTKKTLDNILNRTFPGTSKGREREEERAGCNEFCSYGGSLDSEGSASQSRALPRLSSARLPMRSSVASVNTPPARMTPTRLRAAGGRAPRRPQALHARGQGLSLAGHCQRHSQ